MSGHLRKLSDALGVPLFHSDGRRMLPTAPAHALHEGARDLFATLHGIEGALAPWRQAAQPRGDAKPLRVAARQPGPCASGDRIDLLNRGPMFTRERRPRADGEPIAPTIPTPPTKRACTRCVASNSKE
ncbi:MAG: hypothetical protein ACHP83_18315 [Burkholderiales bacterium]